MTRSRQTVFATGARPDGGEVDLDKLMTKEDLTAVAADLRAAMAATETQAHLVSDGRDGRRGCDPALHRLTRDDDGAQSVIASAILEGSQ